MIVSHNELVAAVNKAFLGMRRHCGEADVIANMVADLQMVGLNGVRHFNNASLFLNLDSDCAVTITGNTDSSIEIELHNGSVACHLPAVLDFALEKMINTKSVTITLKQCHNRWLAYSELARLSAKGIACRAQWVNGTSPKRTLYVLNRGHIAPEVFFSDQVEDHSTDYHSMTIELSVNDFDIEASSQGYSIHIEGEELSRAQKQSWDEGIAVEDAEWETLKQTATVFLVENSERSIQGAGELV
ncbi:hypothetical protein GCM10007906_34500 [Vibrio hyugaensis]|jgi:hypothetical protein|uniref:DUF3726 domain-containing protein n=2 Tax=Vibrio TaxID=662 RepID=A0AAU9QU00_9VIBR|nr:MULTISPECIES: DUF3726 domain-containing protein [Vibrio]KIP67176.1 hypothetical protein SN10_21925 [Vibrio harveyi]KIP77467.1 hypothetical protein SN11_09460 [Vibrio harveyi]PAW08552.1 DUF3726 domain-containing protein [Vibrio sp. V1B]PMO46583.1 hypothetical protein BCT11_04805 [Vibrio sp. 10N.222.52.B12]PQJ70218.1 hypothetical protein BTO01_02555 [Vibrio jasicida]